LRSLATGSGIGTGSGLSAPARSSAAAVAVATTSIEKVKKKTASELRAKSFVKEMYSTRVVVLVMVVVEEVLQMKLNNIQVSGIIRAR
jgi:predicted nicotinamide N-methyase